MAIEALGSLREGMVSLGCADLSEVIVHHDKDSVYTSYRWLERLLLEERARLSYAERGAKDNPWIESFWGCFTAVFMSIDPVAHSRSAKTNPPHPPE